MDRHVHNENFEMHVQYSSLPRIHVRRVTGAYKYTDVLLRAVDSTQR
jgi:hypothetical protein